MPVTQMGVYVRKAFIVLIVSGLAACAAGPDFVRPGAQAPGSWNESHAAGLASERASGQMSEPTTEPIDEHWWAQFHDPVLDSLEARVADVNFDIRVATLRFAQSRAQRLAVAGRELPGVNTAASYQRQRQSQAGASTHLINVIRPPGNRDDIINRLGEPFDLYQVGFDASWELDWWGSVRRAVESADARVAASAATRRDVQLTVMAELARNYLEWRGTQRQLEIAVQDVKTSQEMLELIDQRAAGGLITDLDVASQEARLAEGRAQVTQLKQQLRQTINALAFLLGEQPGALENELEATQAVPSVPLRIPVGVPSEVARRRPDIRAAEARLHAATADIGVAVADLYPRITLTGSFATQALTASDLGAWSARQWSVGPSLILPVFDGGRRRATVELRKAEQQEAAVNYQRVVLQAWHEIDNALTAYASEQLRQEALADAVHSSHIAFEVADTRYQHGLTNFLNALDAQRTLLQAQRDYADSTTAIATRLVALYKALGGGWRSEGPDY
jgi:NodT family efflux transporter outer membrane factor (OMF) lipoprotein